MIIYQSLHGYHHGHDKLASSINLPLEDENLMRVMSDWTGFTGIASDDMSYITCYGLPKTGFYVIAKTWYADEMPRPGCVWTHSLILNLDEIDDNFDFKGLKRYFRRPTNNDYEYFSGNIIEPDNRKTADSINAGSQISNLGISQIEYLIYHLVNGNRVELQVETFNEYYQDLCLSLLQYMPLKLANKLSLCTGADYVNNSNDISFNLIFDKRVSKKLNDCEYEKVGNDVIDKGIDYFANSLIKGKEDDQLIRMFSKDIGDVPKRYFLTGWLLTMLDLNKNLPSVTTYNNILSEITGTYPSTDEGVLTKKLFLRQNVASLFVSDKEYCELACTTLNSNSVDWRKMGLDDYIVSLLNSYDKKIGFLDTLIRCDTINEIGNEVIRKESFSFSSNDIERTAVQQWNIYIVLLKYNYLILNGNYWLNLPDNKIGQILPNIFNHPDIGFSDWDKLLSKCIRGKVTSNESYLERIYKSSEHPATIIMDFISEHSYDNLAPACLRLLLEDIKNVLKWLEKVESINDHLLFFIIDNIKPQSKAVKEYGVRAWKTFYYFDKFGKCIIQYYIFSFLMSLNWKDEFALKIERNSFYHVYIALAESRLDTVQLGKLNRYMPDLPIWQSWDNCKKLCKGTVRAMISLGYEKKDIIGFTPDDNINKRLMKTWKKESK